MCLWPARTRRPLPSPPSPSSLDGNDDDTRLINYPRRGFKWRPPPKGDGDPFEREKTFFLPINPNYRLSRSSPRERFRELSSCMGKSRGVERNFPNQPNYRNKGGGNCKGNAFGLKRIFFLLSFFRKLFLIETRIGV